MPEQEPETEQITNAHRLVYFAAERTLMAWVRTALGMMALGFVIDRFGLVLRQITPATDKIHVSGVYSFWGGDLLVLAGALMALVAAIRYWLFAHDYRRKNSTNPGHGIYIGVIFTAIIALLGFVIAAFLLTVK
jgi:putative membrane protein